MKVIGIEYCVDMEDVLEYLDELSCSEVAEKVGVPTEVWTNMSTTERYDYIYDSVHHNRLSAQELIDLSDEIELPQGAESWSEEEITEYISDSTGWCIETWADVVE